MTVLIVGITGASGAIYGIRLLEVLSSISNVETHLMVSEAAEAIIKYETGRSIEDVRALASFSYDIRDIGAQIASGSFKTDGMIVAPCTMKTMSAIANSYSENLLIRVGDVTLKERRRLLLMVRETPLHIGHLRNMERLCEMGATIMPPVPAFYHKPQTIQDIVDHTVGKMLDIFGIEHSLFQRWSGIAKQD
ncbi:MAG: UbiX family flavin prenyltransferase [Dehalococcoidia bacterium]|nr:UbiX family flavin prenyltransferase [Dehalococcoidia bacterium]MDH4299518.1 UbiX family flavin prenyltransferase [Dehalococcoidia bacterium]MDH4366846.1 UbiX family flavin prenyltransferase [Dehalococcoidia bacterium]